MLKLEKELPKVIERLEALKRHSNVVGAFKKFRTSGSFEVKVVWEICRIVVPAKEICNWYEEYECNDDYVTDLFKAACQKTGLL